jgi:hypothetical protein
MVKTILEQSGITDVPIYCSIFSKDVVATFKPEILSVFTHFIFAQSEFQDLELSGDEIKEALPWLKYFSATSIGYRTP